MFSNSCTKLLLSFKPTHRLQNIVNELGTFRDRYILNYGIANAANKLRDIDNQLDERLEIFLKHQPAALEVNRPYYYYLKGKLLNIKVTYSSEAESLLSKAIKLDPKIVDAWNELGESYFKANEFAKAQSCFEGGLREVQHIEESPASTHTINFDGF